MVEEKKGHVKVTVDVEISPSLMDMMKECMKKIASSGSDDDRTEKEERVKRQ